MNILKTYIIKDIKLNPKKSIFSFISVLLFTFIISCILIISVSIYNTFLENAKNTNGNYHATFFYVDNKYKDLIINNENIDSVFVNSELGYVDLEESKGRNFLNIMAFDDNALKNYGLVLKEGRMPTNSNEIVISEQVYLNGEVSFKVGQTVTFDINKLVSKEGNVLNQSVTYLKSMLTDGKIHKEFLYTKEYKVVGILKRPNEIIEPYKAAGYTAITCLDNIDGVASYSVRFKSIKDIENICDNISDKINCTYKLNNEVLGFEGATNTFNFAIFASILVGIVIIIILICSIVITRSSFSMLVSQKIKQYSILNCIGATKKQIKKIAFYENLILTIFGILFGILLSILISYILVILLNNYIIKNSIYNNINITYKLPVWIIFLSAFLSYITAYISNLNSIKKINKVTPINGVIQNEKINIDTKDLKYSKVIKKIFGIGGLISYKNICRNKTKYKIIVVNLVLSIALFIGITSFVKYSNDLTSKYYENIKFNVLVGYKTFENEDEKFKTLQSIADMSEVDSYTIGRCINGVIDLKKYVKDENMDIYLNMCSYSNGRMSEAFTVLGEDEYLRYINSLGLDYDTCKNKIILVDDIRTYVSVKNKKIKLVDLNVGDELLVTLPDENNKTINLEIVAKTDKSPMGFENSTSRIGRFIISDELLKKIANNYRVWFLALKTNDADNFCKTIERKYDILLPRNYEAELEKENQTKTIISFILYGITVIISVIGICNIVNILSSSINLRKKEFSILLSIGMTKKQFYNMIKLESIFLTLKSIFYGTIFGFIITCIIYYFVNFIDVTQFMFPILEVVIISISIFLIIYFIMYYNLKKILSENIIENTKNENI